MEKLTENPTQQHIHVVGGGTIEPVREHLALAARAYGATARRISELCTEMWPELETQVHLTKMADPESSLETWGHLDLLAERITADKRTKAVFWSPAVSDFRGEVGEIASGMHADRLKSVGGHVINLIPHAKIVNKFRRGFVYGMEPRKDIFAVGFKTTTGANPEEQYSAGLKLVKNASLNLVLANDTLTRNNMVITPEEAPYHETTDREVALQGLVEMAKLRSSMNYTPTIVERGEPIAWESDQIYPALREVVDYCIARGAYKEFNGVTTGHFSAKIGNRHMLSSRRKTNFNDIANVGLVEVQYGENGQLTAYGSKPSAGARAQIEVYDAHPDKDCIVHFHCPTREDAVIHTIEQRPYECGSLECGINTAEGLQTNADGDIAAVMLEKHGPNIVFNHNTDPKKVIQFIEENFDLTAKTGGYIPKD